jgi:hypothetical protein
LSRIGALHAPRNIAQEATRSAEAPAATGMRAGTIDEACRHHHEASAMAAENSEFSNSISEGLRENSEFSKSISEGFRRNSEFTPSILKSSGVTPSSHHRF